MTPAEVRARRDKILAEEIARNKRGLWWLSFADEDKPAGQTFLGVLIVEAYGFFDAMRISHEKGLNPGGEVRGFQIDPADHPEALRNRLLKKSDLAGFGVSTKDIEL